MTSHTLNPHNASTSPSPLPSPLPPSFTLATTPGTDIWRKPPTLDSFNAPILYDVVELAKFRRARVTVRAEWKTLFDQVRVVSVSSFLNWTWDMGFILGVFVSAARDELGGLGCRKYC